MIILSIEVDLTFEVCSDINYYKLLNELVFHVVDELSFAIIIE